MSDQTPAGGNDGAGDGAQLTADAPEMPRPQVRETPAHSIPGGLGLLLTVLGAFAGLGMIIGGGVLASNGHKAAGVPLIIVGVLLMVGSLFCMTGVKMVAPGEARVIQLFGRYVGTIREDGLRWVNPLTADRKISTRVRNHETAVLKVNDAYGNPIELASIVVWQVEDTAQALFEVDDFLEFVATQTEAAVRHIAIEYPYDAHDEDALSLRGNAEEITEKLAVELTARVQAAGVRIIESRFSHLAYAPEIASAMLQRQQAGAVVAARQQIVEGAVGMVEQALARISEQDIVELDEERKAAMVSNLMVVLCGDRAAQPVLNTGSLYQ
ncbi:SPFH domain-containing protein [Streptomyces albofaciens JCM 4342]|uniref:SPFH domain-containing protein n=1 Tax=Streptomyces albofaciens TaxID=66866 RepID=UPI001238795D|nr:SPFH domain-containing protein [Streptomyces albofaciens]KAA6214242.1 SPFH domain-containing protein [Streptomyces albofaciens JCM 4342]